MPGAGEARYRFRSLFGGRPHPARTEPAIGRSLSAGFVALLTTLSALGTGFGAAAAESSGPTRISGQNVLPTNCNPDGAQIEAEVEPTLAVNPVNRDNIIAVWQQDRFLSGGGARSNVAGVTFDGGATWRQVVVPGLSVCSGGTDQRATDPHVTIGPDGTAYVSSLIFQNPPTGEPNAQFVNVSRDGGLTWSDPVEVHRGVSLEFSTITADPSLPGTVYMVWWQANFLTCPVCHPQSALVFARTDDFGKTWSLPVPTYFPPPGVQPLPVRLLRLPSGTIVIVFSEIPDALGDPEALARCAIGVVTAGDPQECRVKFSAQRSENGGLTWSVPDAFYQGPVSAPQDPDTGEGFVPGAILPSVDMGVDGKMYVAWQREEPDGSWKIQFSSSSDAGKTWSPSGSVATIGADAFMPTLAVNDRGTVGVTWYDLRRDVPGDETLSTDIWFGWSQDGGATWKTRHVSGSFDMRQAPRASGFLFLGDYQGLDGIANGFMAVFAQAPPAATVGPSDIFASRLGTG